MEVHTSTASSAGTMPERAVHRICAALEVAGEDFAVNDPRDQVTRQHEEDVDAEVATRDSPGREMKQDDRQHRNGAQPIDVGVVTGRGAHRADGVTIHVTVASDHREINTNITTPPPVTKSLP